MGYAGGKGPYQGHYAGATHRRRGLERGPKIPKRPMA